MVKVERLMPIPQETYSALDAIRMIRELTERIEGILDRTGSLESKVDRDERHFGDDINSLKDDIHKLQTDISYLERNK